MENMSQLILRLLIAAKKAALNNQNTDKNPNSLKIKLLFLLFCGLAIPSDIMSELVINKSNLALLTRQLQKDGLIVKNKLNQDKRSISLKLTDKGKSFLMDCLSVLENNCTLAFGSGYDDATKTLAEAINVLDFI